MDQEVSQNMREGIKDRISFALYAVYPNVIALLIDSEVSSIESAAFALSKKREEYVKMINSFIFVHQARKNWTLCVQHIPALTFAEETKRIQIFIGQSQEREIDHCQKPSGRLASSQEQKSFQMGQNSRHPVLTPHRTGQQNSQVIAPTTNQEKTRRYTRADAFRALRFPRLAQNTNQVQTPGRRQEELQTDVETGSFNNGQANAFSQLQPIVQNRNMSFGDASLQTDTVSQQKRHCRNHGAPEMRSIQQSQNFSQRQELPAELSKEAIYSLSRNQLELLLQEALRRNASYRKAPRMLQECPPGFTNLDTNTNMNTIKAPQHTITAAFDSPQTLEALGASHLQSQGVTDPMVVNDGQEDQSMPPRKAQVRRNPILDARHQRTSAGKNDQRSIIFQGAKQRTVAMPSIAVPTKIFKESKTYMSAKECVRKGLPTITTFQDTARKYLELQRDFRERLKRITPVVKTIIGENPVGQEGKILTNLDTLAHLMRQSANELAKQPDADFIYCRCVRFLTGFFRKYEKYERLTSKNVREEARQRRSIDMTSKTKQSPEDKLTQETQASKNSLSRVPTTTKNAELHQMEPTPAKTLSQSHDSLGTACFPKSNISLQYKGADAQGEILESQKIGGRRRSTSIAPQEPSEAPSSVATYKAGKKSQEFQGNSLKIKNSTGIRIAREEVEQQHEHETETGLVPMPRTEIFHPDLNRMSSHAHAQIANSKPVGTEAGTAADDPARQEASVTPGKPREAKSFQKSRKRTASQVTMQNSISVEPPMKRTTRVLCKRIHAKEQPKETTLEVCNKSETNVITQAQKNSVENSLFQGDLARDVMAVQSNDDSDFESAQDIAPQYVMPGIDKESRREIKRPVASLSKQTISSPASLQTCAPQVISATKTENAAEIQAVALSTVACAVAAQSAPLSIDPSIASPAASSVVLSAVPLASSPAASSIVLSATQPLVRPAFPSDTLLTFSSAGSSAAQSVPPSDSPTSTACQVPFPRDTVPNTPGVRGSEDLTIQGRDEAEGKASQNFSEKGNNADENGIGAYLEAERRKTDTAMAEFEIMLDQSPGLDAW